MTKRAAHDKEGGFHVKLVDENSVGSNKERKIECPICLMIFREPVQAIPCGHRFCESCLNKHKSTQNENEIVCPLDRSIIQVFPDVCHKRDILNLVVECDNVACNETGELRSLEKHLEECPMQIMECTLTCGIKNILRKEMDHHLEHDCVKNFIDCKYSVIGCQFKGRPETLTDHVKESVDEHMFLQVSNQMKEVKCLKEKVQVQEIVIQQMKDKNLDQESVIEVLQSKQKELATNIPLFNQTCPFTCIIRNVSTMMKNKISRNKLRSRRFYFFNGYRGDFQVFLNGDNGTSDHISVFIMILIGPFDDYLKWPMSFGVITIDMFINGECVRKFSMDFSKLPKTAYAKPPNGEGRGCADFFKHDKLPDKIDGDEIKFIVNVTKET